MHTAGDVAFRALGVGAAILLYGLTVACSREPSAPDAPAELTHVPVLRVARARVIEPSDSRIPNPPAVDAWSTSGVAHPVNMAFDAKANRFLIFESPTNQLIEMQAGPDGNVGRLTTERIDARAWGL